ncbi:hypothetical protein ABZ402_07505 [Streptomyces mirabilis]|uniref:hypothetical protein n=1 Tax=Streptomyces mirabilis TaxID=68239 RepID=UPI003400746A
MNDDEAWMAWFIKEYDNMEDPDLRAELLMCHGIHPQTLAWERRRLARRMQSMSAEQTTTPPVSPAPRRTSRATRRPTTPRRAGSPRTYQVKVTRRRRIRTSKGTATVVTVTTTTVTVTTVTTITTIDS